MSYNLNQAFYKEKKMFPSVHNSLNLKSSFFMMNRNKTDQCWFVGDKHLEFWAVVTGGWNEIPTC